MNPEIEKLPEFDNHELVSYFSDKKTGLRGFVAIHNTNLGPAAGGTRYWPYPSEEEALRDVLNLSKAMTYKCAIARVPYGGAKTVIIADPKKLKTRNFLAAYAKVVNLFKGNLITGEDVGMEQKDIDVLVRHSRFIVGRKNKAGDLGPWAALGVFSAMQAALSLVFGENHIERRTFAIKGLGKVGSELAQLIYDRGGHLIGADIDGEKVALARKKFPGIKIVKPEEIHKQKVDIFAPCALGCEINSLTIKEINCPIVCGAANNQLCEPEDGLLIHRRGILYIPDYLANAGGLINVVGELRRGGYDRKWVEAKCLGIRKTTLDLLKLSKKRNLPTSLIADQIAEKMFRGKT
ncbi:MAG: Glu/Leu/Phe/Val dehydrogenase [Candidatus Liptonbacteria bacterium]|nr:Glu/Leu/Phe/Val dehydrogenase [Candidatus Liptonbacteria bacterium]